jgi:hypothetical protein
MTCSLKHTTYVVNNADLTGLAQAFGYDSTNVAPVCHRELHSHM